MNFWLECRSTLRVISARPYKENSLSPLRVSRRHFYRLSMMLWCSMIFYGQERMAHQTSATLQFAMYATLAGSSLLRKLKTRPARLPDTCRANKSEFPVQRLQHYHESRQQFPTPCNQGQLLQLSSTFPPPPTTFAVYIKFVRTVDNVRHIAVVRHLIQRCSRKLSHNLC